MLILTNQLHFLITFTWDALNVNANRTKSVLNNKKKEMFESRISAGASEKLPRQYCHVGNTAQHCRLSLFQDSDFAGDLEDSKSTLGGALCIFGSRTFVAVSWMCKKQTSVSHSSTESEIISLDACLRMDGLLHLDLWVVVIEVFRSSNSTRKTSQPSSRKLFAESQIQTQTRGKPKC